VRARRYQLTLVNTIIALMAVFVTALVPSAGRAFASTTTAKPPHVQSHASVVFLPTLQNECSYGQLAVAAGRSNGAAGTALQPIVFVNDSTDICWIRGYPAVTLSTGASKVDHDVVHERTGVYANPKPLLVVLHPSQVASVGLSYNDVGYTNDAGVAAICRTYRTINVKWRGYDNELEIVHLPQMSYPCGGWFAVTSFERGALPLPS
jgi:hypothetical protein